MVITYDFPTGAASAVTSRASVTLSEVQVFCRYSIQLDAMICIEISGKNGGVRRD
jgi:hypothetical protein